jgi:hypothetical protein
MTYVLRFLPVVEEDILARLDYAASLAEEQVTPVRYWSYGIYQP